MSRGSENRARVREADSIKIAQFPNAVNFRSWQSTVRQEVTAASGMGEVCFKWIIEVEARTTTHDSLADPGVFASLDMKLSAALTKAAHGDLGRQVVLDVDLAAKEGRMLKGRQLLLQVYHWYRTNEALGACFDITDLMTVQLKNDDLSTFVCSWRYTIAGMRKPPRPEDAEALFIEQVRKSNTLKMDVAHYDRQEEGHPDKTMEYLMKCITQILARRREHSTRDAQRRALSEGGVHPTSISFTGAGKDEKGKREKRDKRRSSSEATNDSRQKRGRDKKR